MSASATQGGHKKLHKMLLPGVKQCRCYYVQLYSGSCTSYVLRCKSFRLCTCNRPSSNVGTLWDCWYIIKQRRVSFLLEFTSNTLNHITMCEILNTFCLPDISVNIPGSAQACIRPKVNQDWRLAQTRSRWRENSCWTSSRPLLISSGWQVVRWSVPCSHSPQCRVRWTGGGVTTSQMEDKWSEQSESDRHSSNEQTPLWEPYRESCYPTDPPHAYTISIIHAN